MEDVDQGMSGQHKLDTINRLKLKLKLFIGMSAKLIANGHV